MTRYEKDTKRMKFYTDNTVKCQCGNSVTITNKYNRTICTHCGRMVYKNKKDEFKNRLLEEMRRCNNERA